MSLVMRALELYKWCIPGLEACAAYLEQHWAFRPGRSQTAAYLLSQIPKLSEVSQVFVQSFRHVRTLHGLGPTFRVMLKVELLNKLQNYATGFSRHFPTNATAICSVYINLVAKELTRDELSN